ncbi:hypothetical protein NEOLEDRAFT_1181978 [Neolentinus lepideus HHB14362 ss-1]|uniref:Protein kinase domain-containing protein n=1 Tax=Neolentinus lepideus HHB14362 ss-1 TaxID=1314782 RepID=A0A165PHI3_9AGAM|nr:hypothetical protein NEOLEDRAFT_1181978 [Neolentinus lepideus HHB14362 ss-1]
MAIPSAHVHISFAKHDDWRPTSLQLTPFEGSVITQLGNVHAEEEIYNVKINHSVVYRAVEKTTGRSIILKFARARDAFADIRAEEQVYANQLISLQGVVIPRCFGFYEDPHSGGCIGCLALEDCGDPPCEHLDYLPIVQRFAILRGLQSIHRCGILHESVRRENVVMRDGQVRIIDFGRVSPHSCEAAAAIIQRQSYRPSLAEFPCRDLRNVCSHFGIWSCNILVGSELHPGKNLPPEYIVDELIPRHRIDYATRKEHNAVLARLTEIKKALDEQHILLHDLSLNMVFIGGHPYPSEGFPSQECIDRLVPSYAYTFNAYQMGQLADILKNAKELKNGKLSDEEIDKTAREALRRIQRSPPQSSRRD